MKCFISLFERAFKMMKNGVYFYCDSTETWMLSYSRFWSLQIRWPATSQCWHETMRNHKKWNISEGISCIQLKLCTVVTLTRVPWYVHCDICMETKWAPGTLHLKSKIRVFLLQEVLFSRVVHSVGVSKYGHHTAQAQESPLVSGATNKAFFMLGR